MESIDPRDIMEEEEAAMLPKVENEEEDEDPEEQNDIVNEDMLSPVNSNMGSKVGQRKKGEVQVIEDT